MGDEVIAAKGLYRSYGAREVLADVHLSVSAGEVLGLLGPNGGGKSTLLLLMAGLVRPTAGEMRVCGVPSHEVAVSRHGTVGLITADHGLYPLLTGWENLWFFGGLFGLSRADVQERAQALLDELGLIPSMGERAGGFSSGMRQKLSLVRARMLDPKVLLLDETTANLDPVASQTIYEVLRREADRGLAVVLVTHDLHAAEHICDRVAVVSGAIRHVERLEGTRQPPVSGRLLSLYRQYVEVR